MIVSGPARRTAIKRGLLWGLLALAVIIYGFPFLYLVLTSLKTPVAALQTPPVVWPSHFTFVNYTTVLRQPGVDRSFANSAIVALLSTAISIVLAIPAAYGVTRYRTRSGRIFIFGVLTTRMIPAIAIGVPFVGLMATLHLTDTQIGLALAHVTISLPLSIWLLSSFFEPIPAELEEAARIDGTTRLGAMTRVMVPLAAGGIAVTAVFAFLASWNDFLFALLLTAQRSETTPVEIANFQTQYGLEWGSMTALATLYSLPVVVVTMFFQRRIVSGLTLGAVKG